MKIRYHENSLDWVKLIEQSAYDCSYRHLHNYVSFQMNTFLNEVNRVNVALLKLYDGLLNEFIISLFFLIFSDALLHAWYVRNFLPKM